MIIFQRSLTISNDTYILKNQSSSAKTYLINMFLSYEENVERNQ